MKTTIRLVILTIMAMITMSFVSCTGRQLEVVNDGEAKENQVVTGTLYDASVIFMYDGENIGRFYLGDIPAGKSVKVEIPTKAEKVAISWCFIPKKQSGDKKIDDDLYNLVKGFSTRMLPNFTYLEEKGNTRIVIGDNTYSVMVE